jgi:hypothetical protein
MLLTRMGSWLYASESFEVILIAMERRMKDSAAGRVANWVWRRWAAYWFPTGGRYSNGVVRIAVAAAVLLSFHVYMLPDYDLYQRVRPDPGYQPKSLLRLFGVSPPPAAFFEVTKTIAIVSTWLALIGLFSRFSLLVSLAANLCLVDLVYSGVPFWARGLPTVFLAQLAFAFGCAGDSLSVDAAIRRWRGRPDLPPGRHYQWSIRLAQWVAAMMFANASWYKFQADGYGFGWALSDSLRHYLGYRHYLLFPAPTPLVDWLTAEAWRYKAAGVANFITQCAPVLACLFVRRPRVRAICGAFFVLETVALGVVMDLWNFQWLPLYALFVDWDRLFAWVGRRWRGAQVAGLDVVAAGRKSALYFTAVSLWIIGFAGYYVRIAFWHPIDDCRTFPFTAFAMFSPVWAKQPLDQHQEFNLPLTRFEVTPARDMPDQWWYWVHYKFSHLSFVNDLDVLRRELEAIRRATAVDDASPFWHLGGMPLGQSWDPGYRERKARAWREARERYDRGELSTADAPGLILKRVVFRFEPYPGPLRPTPILEARVASLSADGRFVGVAASARPESDGQVSVEVRTAGLDHPSFRFAYVTDNEGPIRSLEVAERQGRYFFRRPPGTSHQLLIHVSDPSQGDREVTYSGPLF